MTIKDLQELLNRANVENSAGNYDLAEKHCNEIIEALDNLIENPPDKDEGISILPIVKGEIPDQLLLRLNTLLSIANTNIRRGNYNNALLSAENVLIIAEKYDHQESIASTWNVIGIIYQNLAEYSLALDYFSKALSLNRELGLNESAVRVMGNIGNVYMFLSEYILALEWMTESLVSLEEMGVKTEVAVVSGNIGGVYLNLAEYAKALEWITKALALHEELGMKADAARATGNIGLVYRILSEYPKAQEWMSKALLLYEELGMKAATAITMGNIGTVYLDLGEYENGLEWMTKALTMHEELDMKAEAAGVMGNIGLVYKILSEYPKALKWMTKALVLHEELSMKAEAARVTGNIGMLYAEEKYEGYNTSKAKEYLSKAIIMNEELGTKQNLFENHKELAYLYELDEQWKEHAYHFKLYHTLEQEVQSYEAKRQADKYVNQYQLSEREKKLAIEQARNEEIMRQQHILEDQAVKIQLKNTELHEANIELNAANLKLEEMGDFKMKILGIASHDLKNPIMVINMGAEMLLKDTSLSPKTAKIIQLITTSSERMLEIVVNLMDVAARQLGYVKLERIDIDIATLVSHCVDDYLARASDKMQTLVFISEGDCIVSADGQLLYQVFDNLISNAVKYSEKGKEIQVSVVCADEKVTITIADQGQGLSDDDKALLFKDFQKLSSRPTGGEGSTGLGLSVVKHLVELHGGRVWAESEGKGMGSTFFVELPKIN